MSRTPTSSRTATDAAHDQRWPLVIALISTALAAAYTTTRLAGWWDAGDRAPAFLDLRAVTSAADCASHDPDWSVDSATCDQWGRPYNYPALWARGFAALGLGDSDVAWLGFALAGLYAATAVVLWAVRSDVRRSSGLVVAASLAAPPMHYAILRGNVDIIVLALTVLGLWLIAGPLGPTKRAVGDREAPKFAHARSIIGAGVITLAAYLKVFPTGALLALLALHRGARLRAGLVVLVGLAAVVVHRYEFANAASATPVGANGAFGAAVVPILFGADVGSWTAVAIGWLITVAIALILLVFSDTRPAIGRLAKAIHQDQQTTVWMLGGIGLLVSTYAIGASWDYRLMVASVTVVALTRCWDEPAARWTAGTLVVCQFAGQGMPFAVQLVGDLLLASAVAFLAVVAARAAVQQPPDPMA